MGKQIASIISFIAFAAFFTLMGILIGTPTTEHEVPCVDGAGATIHIQGNETIHCTKMMTGTKEFQGGMVIAIFTSLVTGTVALVAGL